MAAINPGDVVRVTGSFTNLAGSAVDPAAVVLRVRSPAGAASTPTVTKDAVGSYHADVIVPAAAASAGVWRYRWEGTGAAQAAEEGSFRVDPSPFVS